MDNESIRDLMCAVVKQAIRDYQSALRNYNTTRSREYRENALNVINECQRFLRESSSAFCNIDGERIIVKIREDVRIYLEKKNIMMEVPE